MLSSTILKCQWKYIKKNRAEFLLKDELTWSPNLSWEQKAFLTQYMSETPFFKDNSYTVKGEMGFFLSIY